MPGNPAAVAACADMGTSAMGLLCEGASGEPFLGRRIAIFVFGNRRDLPVGEFSLLFHFIRVRQPRLMQQYMKRTNEW